MGNFSESLEKFAELSTEKTNAAIKKTALTITRRIIMRTPVLTGRARGNWLTSFGQPRMSAIDRLDPGGASAMADAAKTTRDWDIEQDGSFFLSNNLPYIERIEAGDFSKKAPRGMVGITLTEFDAIVQGNLR